MSQDARFRHALSLGDDHLVLGHRLSQWAGKAPTLEEELALANIGLDLLGQARALYQLAGEIEGKGRTEDDLAYLRHDREFLNIQLVEQPNGDFGQTIARQLFFTAAMKVYWPAMAAGGDPELAAIAGKAAKESAYHFRHAAEWTVRLGDGTEESKRRMQAGVDKLWEYTGELFETGPDAVVDRADLKADWDADIDATLARATLSRPEDSWMATGGRDGLHGEQLGHMLAEMQYMQRAYPGMTW